MVLSWKRVAGKLNRISKRAMQKHYSRKRLVKTATIVFIIACPVLFKIIFEQSDYRKCYAVKTMEPFGSSKVRKVNWEMQSDVQPNCSVRLSMCRSIVRNEMDRNIRRLRIDLQGSQSSCQPKIVQLACQSAEVRHSGSRIACLKDLQVKEYDYHTQFDCLLQISRALHRNGNGNGNGNGNNLTQVPRLGHFVHFYGSKSTLQFYKALSVISMIKYLKPAVIFLWNDGLPQGRWWIELLSRIHHPNYTESLGVENMPNDYSVEIVSVRRNQPLTIYGRTFHYEAHKADIVRLEAMISFGGVYFDFDVFAVNDFDPLLNSSFVLGYEKSGLLNNGVIIAAPNAPFAILWHCEYAQDYDPSIWLRHSVKRPHLLAEACPHLIRRENTSLNQPNNYGNICLLFGENVHFNLSNNYAVHAWMWQYNLELNENVILRLRHTMGHVWRTLYYGGSTGSNASTYLDLTSANEFIFWKF